MNDRADTYVVYNVQRCRLQLEPFLDMMAPQMKWQVMQTLYKCILNKAFMFRQIVSTIVVLKDLLPPVVA